MFETAKDVADFWNIAHLISVGNPEDWKVAFEALMRATLMLDKQNSAMVALEHDKENLIKLLEIADDENAMYFEALEAISIEHNIDVVKYLDFKD